MRLRFLAQLGALAALSSPVLTTAQVSAVPTPQQSEIYALAQSIVDASLTVPTGSAPNVYAAQFALTVDRSKLECFKVLQAVALAKASPKLGRAARDGLNALSTSLAICRQGTAAGPEARSGNGVGTPSLPSFNPGGGTDYGT